MMSTVSKRAMLSAGWVAGVLVFAAPVHAAQWSDLTGILNEFNLVTNGDVTGNSEVEGRAYIGGNLSGNAKNVYANPDSTTSDLPELIVRGNVSGNFHKVLNDGDAWIGGNVENLEMHGGTAYINGTAGNVNGSKVIGAGIEIPDLFAGFLDMSADLAAMTATATADFSDFNNVKFAADPLAPLTVYSISSSELASWGGFSVETDPDSLVVINVSGTSMSGSKNQFGAYSDATNILWNFHEAVTLSPGATLIGAILAPKAHVDLAHSMEGSMVAASVNLNGELHPHGFKFDFPDPTPGVNGKVPLPAALPLLAAGLGFFGWMRRRRSA